MGRAIRIVTAIAFVMVLATMSGCDDGGDAGMDAGGDGAAVDEGLEVGAEAPDFRMKNQDQGTIALSDYRGVSNVILVFYPLAFTPV